MRISEPCRWVIGPSTHQEILLSDLELILQSFDLFFDNVMCERKPEPTLLRDSKAKFRNFIETPAKHSKYLNFQKIYWQMGILEEIHSGIRFPYHQQLAKLSSNDLPIGTPITKFRYVHQI